MKSWNVFFSMSTLISINVFAKSSRELARQILIVRLLNEQYQKYESKALGKMGSACEEMLLNAGVKRPKLKMNADDSGEGRHLKINPDHRAF